MNESTMQNTTIYLPVCDKAVTAEAGCDYAMPDYQPEIRRLLRVKATLLPPASYVGAGKAEFAGTVRYDILYSGNDGALYSATTAENYQLSAPIAADADVDYSDEIPAFCEPQVELLTGRVTAPRKLSIRCRLRGQIRAFGRHRLCERILGEVSEGTIQRLAGSRQCAALTRCASESFTLSEELLADGHVGELRVILSEAAMHVNEAVPSGEGVGCRGDAVIKLTVCCEGEDPTPFLLTKRVPFSVTVPADGFTPDMCCWVKACCSEMTATVTEDGRILVDLSATAVAEGQGNIPVHYTADLYSTEREDRAVYEEYRFPRADRCMAGNFTQSVYEPLASFGLAPDCEVLDVDASASVASMTCDKGKWIITGDTRMGLLVKEGGEYAAHDISVPFRYEAEGEGGEPMLWAADVTMLSGRTRTEGGRLGIECEMAVSARVCVAETLEALGQVEFGQPVAKPCEMVVAFPERGESLWSVAKRYHAPVAELARNNAVSVSISAPLADIAPIVVNE